jgi:arylformamidase
MRLIDISPPLRPSSPVFPGDTPFRSARVFALGPGCPVNVSNIELSTHAGAHADAPLHYAADGSPIDMVPLAPYLGPCTVVQAMEGAGPVTAAELRARLGARAPQPRLLIRTFVRAPIDRWVSDYRAIAPDAIDWLAGQGGVLIGVDTPSLDPETSKSMDAHSRLLAHDLRVLEGLVLDDAPAGEFELIALPLKLEGLDAAPVRAVLRAL